MEVTSANFKKCLGEIKEAIQKADFVAIDAEFTGLRSSGSEKIGCFDTPEERYQKLKKGSHQFLILQVGLAPFQYDTETKRYTSRPYNFYVFPRPFSRQAPDRSFLCQSSSIDFLVAQGFDFNKVFRDGISYLTSTQEQHLKESIEKKYVSHQQFSSPSFTSPHGASVGPNKGPVEVPEEQKEFMDDTCQKIKDFVEQTETDTLQLPQCSAFQRKLIYQTARLKFSNIHLETKVGEKKERFIVISRVQSEEDIKAKEKAKMEAEMTEVEEAVGFCKVAKMLSQSGKLVVGHNMMLDLMHILNQFYFPLPEEYEDFKDMVKCIFPRFADTKLMAHTTPFKEHITSSVLGDLRRIVEAKPFVKPQVDLPEDFCHYGSATEYLHEAGYDAYITGLCFITLSNYLGTFQDPVKESILPTSPLVEPFINKLYMMLVSDIPYINLGGPDLMPNREHMFHVTFPKEWLSQEICHLFAPFGNIQISWINESSALVALYRKDNASAAFKALSKGNGNVKVITYEAFKKQKQGIPCAVVTRKRKSSTNNVNQSAEKKMDVDTPDTPEESGEKEEKAEEKTEEEKEECGQSSPDSTGPSSEKKARKMFDEPEVW